MRGETCSYNLKASKGAKNGDLVYVKIEESRQTTVSVSIGRGLTSARNIFCWLQEGDMILVRHPDTVFISSSAKSNASKIKAAAFYSETYRAALPIVNFEKCSDYGANLYDLLQTDSEEEPT